MRSLLGSLSLEGLHVQSGCSYWTGRVDSIMHNNKVDGVGLQHSSEFQTLMGTDISIITLMLFAVFSYVLTMIVMKPNVKSRDVHKPERKRHECVWAQITLTRSPKCYDICLSVLSWSRWLTFCFCFPCRWAKRGGCNPNVCLKWASITRIYWNPSEYVSYLK